jgi:dTDP-4-amino-4,6-dideoxygalactose transaminase
MSDDTPALLGGPPIRPEGPPEWPGPDPHVLTAVQAAHADGSWGKYLGPNVPRLEELLGQVHGVPHVVTCGSGTLAVEVALRAVAVGPGDEVILAAYEFEPSFLTIHELEARPILVDTSPTNAGLDPNNLEAAITPATRAVLVSHLHGGLVPMSAVMDIAGRHSVAVVEDAAQATGATVEGRPAGTWGDVGVLSFGGSKLLTAGRGGAVLTRHADLLQRARLALGRGVQQWAALSELQAAVLVPQLRKLTDMTALRRERVGQVLAALRDIPGLRPFGPEPPDSRPAYYKLGFFLDEAAFGLPRDAFVKALRAEGIAFDPGFRALHVGRAPARYRAAGPLPNAEAAGRTVVGLHHPVLALGPAEVDQVAAAIRKTYRNAARLR